MIHDARAALDAPFGLHSDGFTLISSGSAAASLLPDVTDPHDRAAVVQSAYPAVARAVEAALHPAKVRAVTYSHMHRHTLQCPSFTVHNDYTAPRQALKQAQKVLVGREEACEDALALPFCMVNVWTPLAPVGRDPLAVCRWRNGRALEEMAYPAPHPGLDEWYYFPRMRQGEAVLFKQLDSTALAERQPRDAARSAYTLHTSFRHPLAELARPPPPPRRSIEYRVLLIEDPEECLPHSFGERSMAALAEAATQAAAERAAKASAKAGGGPVGRAIETTGMRAGTA